MALASLILSALALIVVTYYTLETVRIRQTAQQQMEISVMPMFAVYVYQHDGHRRLRLKNVGLGTAFNLSINKPKWGDQSIEFMYDNHNVMQPKQRRNLLLHHDLGGHTGTRIDSADLLYEWINKEKIPDPLRVVVECESIYQTRYQFVFHFMTGNDFRLKIALSDVKSLPKQKRK